MLHANTAEALRMLVASAHRLANKREHAKQATIAHGRDAPIRRKPDAGNHPDQEVADDRPVPGDSGLMQTQLDPRTRRGAADGP
jgi:hypothetical protein